MPNKALEERIAVLEQQVAALTGKPRSGSGRGRNWKSTRGAFTGDALIKEVVDRGHEIRTAAQDQNGHDGPVSE